MMKNKNLAIIIAVVVISIIISAIIAGAIFTSPKNRRDKVPVVQVINSNFPDATNDSAYTSFFNDKALAPTQLIQIGTSQNETPFNSQ